MATLDKGELRNQIQRGFVEFDVIAELRHEDDAILYIFNLDRQELLWGWVYNVRHKVVIYRLSIMKRTNADRRMHGSEIHQVFGDKSVLELESIQENIKNQLFALEDEIKEARDPEIIDELLEKANGLRKDLRDLHRNIGSERSHFTNISRGISAR